MRAAASGSAGGCGAEASADGAAPSASHAGAVVATREDIDILRVLEYCPWEQRAAVASTSAEVWRKLGHPPSFCGSGGAGIGDGEFHWHFLCKRLAEEHNVHIPRPSLGGSCPPPGVAESWRALFFELFPSRHRLDGSESSSAHLTQEADEEVGVVAEHEQFKIGVAARLRPAVSHAGDDEPEEQVVILPLHQKVQIVRDRYGCSRKEAMQLIMKERGKVSLDDPFANGEVQADDKENDDSTNAPTNTSSDGGEADPLAKFANQEEDVVIVENSDGEEGDDEAADAEGDGSGPGGAGAAHADAHVSILAVQEDSGSVLTVAPGVGLRVFRFDRVFGEKAMQTDMYDRSAQRLVMEFLNGVNASIICYGQTGSGKTYTMFGPPNCSKSPSDGECAESLGGDVGVVPRACEEVLRSMRERRERGINMELGMSYVEVFGSEVSDLLRAGRVVGQGRDGRYSQVRATDRVGHRYVLDGHTEFAVESWDEVQGLLESGNQAKRLASTAMNERSTRAHTLLVLTLTQKMSSGFQVRSRLFLADLGGSEKVSKSKADEGLVAPVTMVGGVEVDRVRWAEYYRHRQRIQETLHINAGLFALKKVIEALQTRSQMREQGAPAHTLPYVPYQDSKLTMLLKDALGGNSRTLVLCTASMDSRHAPESLQTFRFAERCAQVRTQNDGDTAASVQAALRQLDEKIKAVEAEIVRKERWETRLIRRKDVDTVAGAFGAEHGAVVREEVIPTSVLVGAESEREELERLLQRQLDLRGLGGAIAKDYRDMKAQEAADGGKGQDFRAKDHFRKVVKAKDFEDEAVVAEALRYFFRKAETATEIFGETEATRRRRMAASELHEGYIGLAQWLRQRWEEESSAGTEKRSFGKSMLDRTQEWSAAFKKAPASRRDEALRALIAEWRP